MELEKQLNQAFDLIDKWQKMDDHLNDAFVEYFKVVCPNNITPIAEVPIVQAVVDTLSTLIPNHADDFSYYAWELPIVGEHEDVVEGSVNGKTYNLRNRNEFVAFCIERTEPPRP